MKKINKSFAFLLVFALLFSASALKTYAAAGAQMEVRVISASPAQMIEGNRQPVSLLEKLKANGWSNGDIALLRTQIGVILKAALELEAKIKAFAENNQ